MKDSSPSGEIVVEDLDRSFRDEVAALPGGENIGKCFACGTCAAGCPVTAVDEEYNSRRIIRQIIFGQREEVLGSPQIWLCAMCYRCTSRCPQQVNFTDVMRALRYLAVRHGYAPAELLDGSDETERQAQSARRDLIRGRIEQIRAGAGPGGEPAGA